MKQLLMIAGVLVAGYLHAQDLVANGSFEDENICTEYSQNCAPEAWIATSLMSNYYFDSKLRLAVPGYDGSHFVGLVAGNVYTKDARNFMRTRLLCGLQKGHQYRLSFYLRANNAILDSVGIYFSPTDFLFERRSYKALAPQLWTKDALSRSRPNDNVWQKVQFIYTADGTEGYLTIGNFKRVDYYGVRRGELRYDYYIFYDSISLKPVDPKEQLCAQADSVKTAIYAENERHEVLDRKIYAGRRNPPATRPLPFTQQPAVQRIDTLVIPDIFFATASYELNSKSFNTLDSFANKLSSLTIDSMVVEGHTDSIGKLAYNETLSRNRANSVKDYLSGKVGGLQAKSVVRGYAFLRPVATNKTPKGRQQNRRVEIFVYRKE